MIERITEQRSDAAVVHLDGQEGAGKERVVDLLREQRPTLYWSSTTH
jgi:hypothetical protein